MTSIVLIGLVAALAATTAPTSQPEPAAIALWPGRAPEALGTEAKDTPTLAPYLTANGSAKNMAIIICPGGGYSHLAPHEGRDYALFLSERGISCFVLKYRVAKDGYHHPVMLMDAARAVRFVRANAEKWGIDPTKVGIMGSSAGGHVASTLMTNFDGGVANAPDEIDRQSSRPDFAILCYPVITMGKFTHTGSKRLMLGEHPTDEAIAQLSNELHVTDQTPPTFIWHGSDDASVPVENTLMFAASLREHHVPVEMHIYEHARHGLGLGDLEYPFKNPLPWTSDLVRWLEQRTK